MTMPTTDFLPYPDGYELAQTNVPLVTHLHGGEVQSTSDGHPEAWYTSAGLYGPEYSTNDIYPTITPTAGQATFYYPNEQPPTTLWYHDHALGVTRTNVMSGLAGFYLLREKGDPMTPYVPPQKWEIPIVIQDRSFNTDGSMWFPTEGNNPEVHPYWNPEFFGDTIMVNGKVWPNLDVDRGVYRFRLLDGSNARFYTLKFEVVTGETNGIPTYGATIPFFQIGSDGGYLKAAAGPLDHLSIGPGERVDILIDFSSLAKGDKVILTNSADIPFRGEGVAGDEPPDPATVGQIMQFTCKNNRGYPAKTLPETLNPTLTDPLGEPDVSRALVLMEAMQDDEPVAVLLNGQDWDAATTEEPVLGTTEDWIIINPTADTHPIHLHLVQFQLVGRRSFDVDAFLDDWMDANSWDNEGLDAAPNNLLNPDNPDDYDFDDFWTGDWIGPAANEMAWKDTIQMNPGDVTIIRIRFAPTDGIIYDADTLYPFDATEGPGYVWHCHILDHEDNEMMRPYIVTEPING